MGKLQYTNPAIMGTANFYGVPAYVGRSGIRLGTQNNAPGIFNSQTGMVSGGGNLGTYTRGGGAPQTLEQYLSQGGASMGSGGSPGLIPYGNDPNEFAIEGQTPGFQSAPNIMNYEAFEQIGDYLRNPIGMSGVGLNAIDFANEQVPEAMDMFAESLPGMFRYGNELMETGFRTDVDPYAQAGRHQLMTQLIPDLAEQWGGTEASGWAQETSRAAGDYMSNVTGMQTGLDEAAAARRGAALNTMPSILAGAAGAPAALSADAMALDAYLRAQVESTRPGQRLWDAHLALSGAGAEGGAGYSPSGGGSNLAAPIIQAFGSIAGGAAANWASDSG